uniref:Cilia and flagella associated protein 119 n=1 Tax=Sphenodon punctatus TaxID=8508 RepID=A0A8D0H233_SPHPU
MGGPELQLPQPQHHEARICMWKYLDVHSMDLIEKVHTTEQLKSILADLFHLQAWDSDPRAAILLDLYFYTVQFSREQAFSREQTSAFFSIVKDTHEACVETPLPNVEECYGYFTELVFCHSIQRPPFSIDLFTQEQLAVITDYVVNTYFRHFKLYKYAFTPQVRLDVSLAYVGMPEAEPTVEEVEEGAAASTEAEPAPSHEEVAETIAPVESPTAPLRVFMAAQLNREVSALRQSLEEKLRATEEELGARLSQLEKTPSTPKGAAKGKHK